jgi:hypothetical protein
MTKQSYIEPVAISTTDAAGREHHGSYRYDRRTKVLTVTHSESGESEVAANPRGNEEVLARVMLATLAAKYARTRK